jgi:hypothetical protein
MYGNWRAPMKKMYITAETEIPPMPAKLLPPINDATYHK